MASERQKRIVSLAILGAGGAVVAIMASRGPKDQHVRFVLGDRASSVTALSVKYVSASGEAVRETTMSWDAGAAPRVVALDPALPNGDYELEIDVDAREGRRSGERRVTLGGGTTSVEIP
ncbi:MAG TPA: hypothetical protein VIF62_03925 [Labilithrix sp.]